MQCVFACLQPAKRGDTLAQGSPRKLRAAEFKQIDILRPKTSSTTTPSPRTKDSVVRVNHRKIASGHGMAATAKERLVRNEPSTVLRPHTSPERATVKDQSAKIRPHLSRAKSRASSSKGKSCSDTQIRSNCLKEISEEKREDVGMERDKEQNIPDILVVKESRLGFDNTEEAWSSPSGRQSVGKGETTVRSFDANIQEKESSPPFRNDRYSSGIKIRLAKLFSKENICSDEDKIIEPQKRQVQGNAPYLPLEINDNDSRYS